MCKQSGGEVIETSPPGARVPPPGTAQQRAAPPPFYLNQQQLQMLQYLQQNSANLTPQQQVCYTLLRSRENIVRSLSAFSVSSIVVLLWILQTSYML
jgi:hypothetical protein